jgi:uncharacterized protein (TIGR02444 family)
MEPAAMLDSPFWRFSLKAYAAPGVAEECLDLQERFGLDVNLLLFAAYLGAAEGVTLSADDVAAAAGIVGTWHAETVRGLRALRRALKPACQDPQNAWRGPTAALRNQVKASEVEAERIEQAMLWRWRQTQLGARQHGAADAALAANLAKLLAHYGAPGDTDTPTLRAAALNFAHSKS